MGGSKPKETSEQKAERLRADASRSRAVQRAVSTRTSDFRRLTNPRASLFGGAVTQNRAPLF